MKKIIFLAIAVVLSTTLTSAQTIKKGQLSNQQGPVVGQVLTEDDIWNYNEVELLDFQNKLLNRRKTALIISLCGAGITGIGAAIGPNSDAGAGIATVGSIAVLTGGIWYVVNEFKLINSQKRLNEHMRLKCTPTSIALEF